MENAVAFAMERTKSPTLFIGGGTTGEAAICDKTPHRYLAQRYRELEMCAHTNSLKYKPGKVPRWTKQQVLERGWQAWQDLDHRCGEELHRTHGYTTKVDGSQDKFLDSSIAPFWKQLGMRDARLKIATQVKTLMEQKIVREWSDAAELLEAHDPHRVSFEGEEDFHMENGSDSEDSEHDVDDDAGDGDDGDDVGDDDAGDDDDGDGGPGGLATHGDDADLQGDVEGDADRDDHGDDDAAGGGGGGPDDSTDGFGQGLFEDAAAPGGETCREEATRTLRDEKDPDKVDKLERIGAMAEEIGQGSLARDIKERVRKWKGGDELHRCWHRHSHCKASARTRRPDSSKAHRRGRPCGEASEEPVKDSRRTTENCAFREVQDFKRSEEGRV